MLSTEIFLKDFERPSNMSLILATVWITTKLYPSKTRGHTLIGQYCETKVAYVEQTDLIQAILLIITKSPITRILLETDRNYGGEKNHLYEFFYRLSDEESLYRLNANMNKAVWFVDGLESFKQLEASILNERNRIHRSGFFCIIYTGRETDRFSTLRTIFQRLFDIYVVNVNVLMGFGDLVHIYTYFPFTETSCHNVEPFFQGVLGPFTHYQYIGKELFPKKLYNMWGCKLNITAWTEAPFMSIEYNRSTGELKNIDGMEGRIIHLLSKRMNFSIKVIEATEEKVGSATEPGLMKMLVDGVTNITISYLLYDKSRKMITDPAYSYAQIPLILAIPLGDTMSSLERLIRPFTYTIWIVLSSSVIIGIIILFLLKGLNNTKLRDFIFGHGNRIPFTNLWRTFYGVSISGILPRRNFARYILAIWILYTFIIRSAYLAQLFKILKDSRTRSQLSTVKETLQKNFIFYAYPSGATILKDVATKPIKVKFIDDDKNNLENLFNVLSKDEDANIVVTVLQPFTATFNDGQKNPFYRVNVLQEPLLHAPITFYMRKHSYLTNEINEHLLDIMSAGLIKRYMDLSWTQRLYNLSETGVWQAIPLNLLTGLFLIHLFLLIMCTLIFLLELWSKNSLLAKNCIEFFNY